jgi:cytochrome c1
MPDDTIKKMMFVERRINKRFPHLTDRGDEIKGSQYFREYCYTCGTAMRVQFADLEHENYCTDCKPRSHQSLADALGYSRNEN